MLSKSQVGGKELMLKERKGTAFGDKIFYITIAMMLIRLEIFFKTHQIALENREILTNSDHAPINSFKQVNERKKKKKSVNLLCNEGKILISHHPHCSVLVRLSSIKVGRIT